MLACAADEIICNDFSIVGSIGVVGASFGFHELMEKVGIERRIYTSGDRKVMLDPFLPEKPDDVKRIKAIQKDIHEHFIALVKERRGSRLNGTDKTLFSGEFWTAQKAIELGLADRLGDMRSTLRERYGDKVHTPLISAERQLFGRRLPGVNFADALTRQPGLADDLISALEIRARLGPLRPVSGPSDGFVIVSACFRTVLQRPPPAPAAARSRRQIRCCCRG